jgi:peptide/nickel transport system substrate-binding protein
MIKRLRWPILISLLALAIIAVLLVEQKPTQTQIEPVLEPAAGGIYTEGIIGTMVRLNPLLDDYNSADRDVDRLLFNGLVRIDDRGLPQADLADSWGISQDGKVYNFSLRQNTVWHDQTPLTSDDVIFTIEKMREDGSPLPADVRNFWKQVEVVRLDDNALQFRLTEPFAPFLDYLTFGILPAHIYGDMTLEEIIASPDNLNPVGTGPYRFKQFIVEDDQIVGVLLEPFVDFYDKPPFIEQVAFRYYPDSVSAMQAYQREEIMGLSQVPLDILPEVLAAPKLNLYTVRLPELSLIIFNLNNPQVPFLQNADIRRALYMAVNRRVLIDRILDGQAIMADGPIFPGTWAYYDGIEKIGYNPETAIEILKQSGFTIPAEGGSTRANEAGDLLKFELLYPDDDIHRALAEIIQKNWQDLGMEVSLKSMSYENLIAELDNRTHQAVLVDINLAQSPDPDPYPFWHQSQITGGQNYAMWDDRQASEYLEQARITVDSSERARLYRNFQVRFMQELPALPLYYPVYRYAINSDVQGVQVGPLFDTADRFATITQWYLVTKHTNFPAVSSEELTPTP